MPETVKPLRKAIGKKLRFEVFKRDSFKCQYCGESAPDVVLHVDHIRPVKEGGDNSLVNLITSCNNCNLGKGSRTLNDNSSVKKQKQQLDELNERRQQLEMMMQWRQGLMELDEKKFWTAHDQFCDGAKCGLSENGQTIFRKLVKKYPFDILLESIDAALNQYLLATGEGDYTDASKQKAFDMVGRICAVKIKQRDKPYLVDVAYTKGILRNRFQHWQPATIAELGIKVERILELGGNGEAVKTLAKRANNFNTLWDDLDEMEAALET